jgi:hypothetical protein
MTKVKKQSWVSKRNKQKEIPTLCKKIFRRNRYKIRKRLILLVNIESKKHGADQNRAGIGRIGKNLPAVV